MSPDRRMVAKALLAMRPAEKDSLVDQAKEAESRDPKIDPKSHDCLMASAGGAAAVYRHVISVPSDTVHFDYSSSPFGREKSGECTLAKWRQWAARATVQHWSSTEIFIPGAGWQLHSDILAVAQPGECDML